VIGRIMGAAIGLVLGTALPLQLVVVRISRANR